MSGQREDKVRSAFAEQLYWCERLGSPFTARLCGALTKCLDRKSAIGAAVLDWAGDPAPAADSVPLRLCSGLHRLVRSGEAPRLAPLYPPARLPDEDTLIAGLVPTLAQHGGELAAWIKQAPQTNEVGRSAVLMSGLLVAAAEFGLPIRLFELGASAGLNLNLDRYGYDFAGLKAGEPASSLQISPDWKGCQPPEAVVQIVGRSGVDINPIDPRQDADRLLAYVWPDQTQRLRQLELALEIAARHPPSLARDDAAAWIEQVLAVAPEVGILRIVMHSVAYQYFPIETQKRVADHVATVGLIASTETPIAWLRFEKNPEDEDYGLRLRTWPGDDRLLAWAHPHGNAIHWVAT